MATEKYVPPQRRAQKDDSEGIHTSSLAADHFGRKNDGGGENFRVNADWLLKDTTQEITSFDAARLEVGPTAVESNTDSELLCTYNWMVSKSSTIYVPGMFFQPPRRAKDCANNV